MSALYRFENHDIRVVFIDDRPWLVRDDLAPCLELSKKKFRALVSTYEPGLDPNEICAIRFAGADPEAPPTCLYSSVGAGWFALLAVPAIGKRFELWLDDVFEPVSRPIRLDQMRECEHFHRLEERVQGGLKAINGVIDLLRSIYGTHQDLHEVNTVALTKLLMMVRDEFEASETLMRFACRCVMGKKPC